MLDSIQKLAILADAAKYDASCASSGSVKRHSLDGKGIGSTEGGGICHAYTPDGRCISLLKILMTNYCMFDCAYCINRVSSNVQRARFTVNEVVELTLSFYKRNYIEGLFLSSGIIKSPDYTMEQMVRIARNLREEHQFRGYIHLKTIPDADQTLLDMAGLYADRLSINVELPLESSLKTLAPEKTPQTIRQSMGHLSHRIIDNIGERKESRKAPRFAPAGQSTQVIVGADAAKDMDILQLSGTLYHGYKLKRVYYSAFSPIPDASSLLPLAAPPLVREHRLYQADWLLRFYGFSVSEISEGTKDGMFDTALDPKMSWALANRALFPLDLNKASKAMLLRVPGLGTRAVEKIIATRRYHALRLEDVKRLTLSLSKCLPFIMVQDWQPSHLLDDERLMQKVTPKPRQLDLFAA